MNHEQRLRLRADLQAIMRGETVEKMVIKDNTKLREELTAILVDDLEQPLVEAVLENYAHYHSIRKVSTVLSRYYGRHIPQYSVSRILKDNGVEIKARNPSIYDSQL